MATVEPGIWQQYQRIRQDHEQPTACWAPARIVYFGLGGMVYGCSRNRTAPLGQWPQQSIDDIISSTVRSAFAERMKEGDFPGGCAKCVSEINTKQFDSALCRRFDGLADGNPDDLRPRRLEFELVNTCNLECIMCSGHFSSAIRTNRDKLPLPAPVYTNEFVQELRPHLLHIREACFLGGEPFLIGLYYTIWEQLNELNPSCTVYVQTSGTAMNRRAKALLEEGRLNFSLGLSIDTLHPERYEQIRVNASYATLRANLDWLLAIRAQRPLPLNLSICPMRQNWMDMPDMMHFANGHDIPVILHRVLSPLHCAFKSMPYDELKQVCQLYEKCLAELPGASKVEQQNKAQFHELLLHVQEVMRDYAHDSTSFEARVLAAAHKIDPNNAPLLAKTFQEKVAAIQNRMGERERLLGQKLLHDSLSSEMMQQVLDAPEEVLLKMLQSYIG